MLDGIELTFHMQLKRSSPPRPLTDPSDPDCLLLYPPAPTARTTTSIYSPLYRSLLKGTRKRRFDFLGGLLRRAQGRLQHIAARRKRLEEWAVAAGTPLGEVLAKMKESDEQQLQQLEQGQGEMDGDSEMISEPGSGSGVRDQAKERVSNGKKRTSRDKHTSAALLAAQRHSTAPVASTLRAALLEAREDLQMVCFLAQTAGSLPFNWQEEPLLVVYWISRNVPVGAGILQRHMQRLVIGCVGEEGEEGGTGHPTATEDTVTINNDKYEQYLASRAAYRHPGPSPESGEGTVGLAVDDVILALSGLEARCKEVLLRLKVFLKTALGLSDERCLAFTPQDDGGGSNALPASASGGGSAVGSGSSAGGGKGLAIAEKDRLRLLESSFSALPPSATSTPSATSSPDAPTSCLSLDNLIMEWCESDQQRTPPTPTDPHKISKSAHTPPSSLPRPLPPLAEENHRLRWLLERVVEDLNRLNGLVHAEGDDYQHVTVCKRRTASAKRGGRAKGKGGGSGSDTESDVDSGSEGGGKGNGRPVKKKRKKSTGIGEEGGHHPSRCVYFSTILSAWWAAWLCVVVLGVHMSIHICRHEDTLIDGQAGHTWL